jgi:hypothetical protein
MTILYVSLVDALLSQGAASLVAILIAFFLAIIPLFMLAQIISNESLSFEVWW